MSARRHVLPCPRCFGFADVDARALVCRTGCAPIYLPEAPLSAWELALEERLNADYEDRWGDPWAVAALHDPAWDLYSSPKSRLQDRWGAPEWKRDKELDRMAWVEPPGVETTSVEGARLNALRAENITVIATLSDALRAFGESVKADDDVVLRGGTTRPTPSYEPCLAASAAWASTSRVPAEHAEKLVADGLAQFWGDARCRSLMLREVGSMLCIEVHRAIVMRGGSFKDLSEVLRHLRTARTTPFAHYPHAIAFWCGDHGSTTIGAGSQYAGVGGAEAKFSLPHGVQFKRTAVHPSRNGATSAKNVGTLELREDVSACIAAARVGGTWSVVDRGAASCEGGRPLRPWERALIALVDFGTEVEEKDGPRAGAPGRPKKNWRKLAVTEAVGRLRAEREQYPDARHLTTEDAKRALRDARAAIHEALQAWGLIPPPRPRSDAPAAPPAPEETKTVLPRRGAGVATWRK